MIQFYGSFTGHFSGQNVSRAYAHALKKFPTTIWELGSFIPTYEGVEDIPVGFAGEAPIGVAVGYPWNIEGILREHPEHRILATVCETTPVPSTWVEVINKVTTQLLVPSEFCVEAFQTSGVKVPIMVVPHGVDPIYTAGPAGVRPWGTDDEVWFLHVSGAVSYPGRKGTNSLLLAFQRVVQDPGSVRAKPFLKMKKTPQLVQIIDNLGLHEHVKFLEQRTHSPAEMPALLRCFDAVVQPSRAEGFGMVPLEARCAGVPVILTDATGHKQHLEPNVDIVIPTGPKAPLVVVGNDQGSAPSVRVLDIETALRTFLADPLKWKSQTFEWAREYAHVWHWSKVMEPFQKFVGQIVRETHYAPHPGEVI